MYVARVNFPLYIHSHDESNFTCGVPIRPIRLGRDGIVTIMVTISIPSMRIVFILILGLRIDTINNSILL